MSDDADLKLDGYETAYPLRANSFDIFKGEWSSTVPEAEDRTGKIPLFADRRLELIGQHLGGFSGKRILELGPLEGGHTYMMHKLGAESVLAIEANKRSFLKCLIVKYYFDLNRAEFRLGDFFQYLSGTEDNFDAVVASGVLYHAADPVGMIKQISRITNKVGVWTHYFDRELIEPSALEQYGSEPIIEEGLEMWERRYPETAVRWGGFCGGPLKISRWMSRGSLLSAFERCGFKVSIIVEQKQHQNGPNLLFAATK